MQKLSGTCTTPLTRNAFIRGFRTPNLRVKHSNFPAFLEGPESCRRAERRPSVSNFQVEPWPNESGRPPAKRLNLTQRSAERVDTLSAGNVGAAEKRGQVAAA